MSKARSIQRSASRKNGAVPEYSATEKFVVFIAIVITGLTVTFGVVLYFQGKIDEVLNFGLAYLLLILSIVLAALVVSRMKKPIDRPVKRRGQPLEREYWKNDRRNRS